MDVPILNIENAPERSKPWLEATANSMGGFLPNLYRQMANAPMVLETYLTMSKLLSSTSFTFAEQQLILLTASARNGCKYCVAAHSSGARMAKLDRNAVDAVRDGLPAEDTKLEALRQFVEKEQWEHAEQPSSDSTIGSWTIRPAPSIQQRSQSFERCG